MKQSQHIRTMSGFSPHQLVFGENMKLPNITNDQLSAGSPETKTIGYHLLALHAARIAHEITNFLFSN